MTPLHGYRSKFNRMFRRRAAKRKMQVRIFSTTYDVAMADLAVQIFTFTTTESAAVDELITGMATVTWTPAGDGAIGTPRRTAAGTTVIRHTPLSAQGNVVAGTALTKGFTQAPADYYIFYGCC